MKKIILLLICMTTLVSCSECKTFKKSDGTTFVAEPYGLANYQSKKIDGVIYEANCADVILGIFCSYTIIPAVYVVGWDIMEPVKYEEKKLK